MPQNVKSSSDTGKEWGGTNSMLELLKRINREKFDITCCFTVIIVVLKVKR